MTRICWSWQASLIGSCTRTSCGCRAWKWIWIKTALVVVLELVAFLATRSPRIHCRGTYLFKGSSQRACSHSLLSKRLPSRMNCQGSCQQQVGVLNLVLIPSTKLPVSLPRTLRKLPDLLSSHSELLWSLSWKILIHGTHKHHVLPMMIKL